MTPEEVKEILNECTEEARKEITNEDQYKRLSDIFNFNLSYKGESLDEYTKGIFWHLNVNTNILYLTFYKFMTKLAELGKI